MNNSPNERGSRREFLRTSSAVMGGILAAPYILPGRARAEVNSATLKIGLIGCGGRGTGAASQALTADENTVLTAVADVFEDRADKSLVTLRTKHAERVQVDPEHRFIGFDAYQKLIDSGVDVVLLATPPGFRPMHLKAAVDAGKHIFTEKPMAVDAPGVRSVLATAEEAKRKKLCLVSGFCWRYSNPERETIKRIHDGAIGDVTALYGAYNAGTIWNYPRQPGWSDMYWQMRNWYYFTWLSGDHIVEQAVHTTDKMAWVMQDVPPVSAVAHGGRQVRTGPEFGHIYDHFSVVYDYANGAKGFHFTRQMANCFNDVSDFYIGTKGACRIQPFKSQVIEGQKPWRYTGPRNDMYQAEHDELFAAIRAGRTINDGVWMAHSTMKAIMGRMAAYTGQRITWEEIINSQESLMPSKLDWDAPLEVPPVPMPGETKLT